jgi:putative endonuclease
MDKLSLGRKSEGIAIDFLRQKGFNIVQKNFYCSLGEIDIIAKHRGVFVFIEVRSTRGSFFHNPIDSISRLKTNRIGILSQIWFKKNHIRDASLRFDVIGITYKGTDIPLIEHVKGAF